MQTESKLYHNRAMSWILPFLEYITAAVALLAGILGIVYSCVMYDYYFSFAFYVLYGSFFGIATVAPILLIAAGLGMIKRNHIFVTVILGVELVSQLVLGILTRFHIVLMLCYVGIIVWYVLTFVRKTDFSSIGKEASFATRSQNTSNEPASQSAVEVAPAKKFCSQCGTEISDGLSFCPKCGNQLK